MLPMAFSPTSGGVLRDSVTAANLHSAVDGATWRRALDVARGYVARLQLEKQLSPSFKPCIQSLDESQLRTTEKMARLD